MNQLKKLFLEVYGDTPKTNTLYEDMMLRTNKWKNERSASLKKLDKNKYWYFDPSVIGMTIYTDHLAKDFKDLINKIPYFKELGVTFIHLMPLLKPRSGENDGGYAVESFRDVNPKLGSKADFIKLLEAFRENGIYVCIDFVINHVAKEHEWAKAALKGDKDKQNYFIMFDDKKMPDLYNKTVPEVLPEKKPGNFTYYPEMKKYVFTSFSDFQWDLNFANPLVFIEMVDNILYLSNLGVNMLRLDAIPFMWKEVGTTCRNLPIIHKLLEMIQLIRNEVAPSVSILGEAIVEPDEIIKYFGSETHPECEIMYNANLMVNVYNGFAARDARLIQIDTNRFSIPNHGTWMNYVRCHDDIGWGFNESAISSFGMDPFAHKQFLINFYNGSFNNSFAKGENYQVNERTKDARTNGTLASLLGLEQAVEETNEFKRQVAINRINLAHSLILFHRGFPLIYSGDEIATLNDQSYLKDPKKKIEGRWVHRAIFDWKRAEKRNKLGSDEYAVFQSLKQMIELRSKSSIFDGRNIQYVLPQRDPAILCIVRKEKEDTYFGIFNFSEQHKELDLSAIREVAVSSKYQNMMSNHKLDLMETSISLTGYEWMWLKPIKK
jgi:amylosucrase